MKTVRPAFPRRQILLFLLAVTLPCIVVVALGLRLVAQDRELAEKRAADERRRIVTEIRQQLAGRLERVRSSAAASVVAPSSDPAFVFTAFVRNGRVVLPWEDSEPSRLAALLAHGTAGALLQAGERDEFGGRLDTAATAYRKAAAAREPAIAAWSRFLLARVLAKADHHAEAIRLNAELATLPFDVTDEHHVPLALYAAKRLVERRDVQLPTRFFVHSAEALRRTRWMQPTSLYLLRDIVAADAAARSDQEAARRLRRTADERLATAEHLEAFRVEVASIVPRQATPGTEHRWHLVAKPGWLVNASSRTDDELSLTGVAVEPMLAALALPDGAAIRWVPEGGESLGEDFPGLRVAYSFDEGRAAFARGRLQQRFYLAALVMVISITLLGGYLLWRDVGREMRLAAMRSQFVASISHELKTPLTSIRMFAETLRMRPASETIRADYLETIVSESERLTRLLNNVLDFSRIEQDRKTYRLVPASLAEVVRAAARTLEYPLAQAGFELNVHIDDAAPPVRADADALLQAVLNLLTNAMKFSQTSRRIDLTLGREQDRAVISVTDRGIGIDAAEHARLFERFYRVRTPDNEQIAGTGLGLTIVQHIVQAHGGDITVRSALGEGSTFSISLPAYEPAGSARVETSAEAV